MTAKKKVITKDIGKLDPATVTRAVAEKAIKHDQQKRVTACSAAIEVVLKDHKCALDVSVVLRKGSIEPQIAILAID